MMSAFTAHCVTKLLPIILSCTLLIYMILTPKHQQSKHLVHQQDGIDARSLLEFIPDDLKYCEDIFSGSDKKPTVPRIYSIVSRLLDYHTSKHGGLKTGHIGDKTLQVLTYLSLVNASFVNTVCETGFNAGHSALVWLVGNPNVTVYSFDYGSFHYSKPNARFLQAAFPGRLKVIWGNSMVTIPRFSKANPQVKCDIIFIDGGHHFPVVHADLRNLRAHVNVKYHLVSIDDYIPIPKSGNMGVTEAWREEIQAGQLKQHFGCVTRKTEQKIWGFAVGRYMNLSRDNGVPTI